MQHRQKGGGGWNYYAVLRHGVPTFTKAHCGATFHIVATWGNLCALGVRAAHKNGEHQSRQDGATGNGQRETDEEEDQVRPGKDTNNP